VIRAFRAFELEDSRGCAALVRAGCKWENACRAVVGAVVVKIREEQEGLGSDATLA
jgi:hypothetical protein